MILNDMFFRPKWSWVQLPARALSSYVGQLSLPSILRR